MSNVIHGGFGGGKGGGSDEDLPKRKNAYQCLKGRLDELDQDDEFTDVLIITYGEDGMAIRTNAGGVAECLMITQMMQHAFLNDAVYGDYYGEDDE